MVPKNKTKILLTTIGTVGDVFPFLGIGRELKIRGYDVSIATNEYFKTVIEQEALKFIELGKKSDYFTIIKNKDLWHPTKALKILAEESLLPLIKPLYEIIFTFDQSSTLIIASGLSFGARIAQEKLHYQLVTVHIEPALLWSAYQTPQFNINYTWFPKLPRAVKKTLSNISDILIFDKMFRKKINSFRKELDLQPVKHIFRDWIHSPQSVIGLFPDWFYPPQSDWPREVQLTDFVFYDKNIDQSLLLQVEEFLTAGDLPIVFTTGTGMIYGKKFFEAAVKACQILNKRGILLTSESSQIPSNLPKQIIYLEHLPFGKYLKKTCAIVHHGGIGTTAQALLAGIPQLITPLSFDQPDNAVRVQKLGVGKYLNPKKIDAKKMALELNYLLNSEQIKASCNKFAKKLQQSNGIGQACSIIENQMQ